MRWVTTWQARLIGVLCLSIAAAMSARSTAFPASYAEQQVSTSSALQLMSQDILTVVDENQQPVSHATILVGFEAGNPFPGNTLTTDASGVTNIPADWKDALPLTVQAPGFITETIPVAFPGNQVIQLTKQEGQSSIEIKGTAGGFGNLVQDGKVDFGMVIPALDRSQMLAFDMSSVMSPEFDTISVFGNSVNIPSNLTLPDQTETYIFPIELNKPDYRSYVRMAGQYRLAAIHGQFPLQRVVNDIRNGKSIFDVINYFTFIEGGKRTVNVRSNVSGMDINVDQEKFGSTYRVKAPSIASGQVMLSLALNEQDGLMSPTDLKRFTSGQQLNLKGLASQGSPYILSLLMEDSGNSFIDRLANAIVPWFAPLWIDRKANLKGNPDFNRLSFTIAPASGTVTPKFLPLINKPVLQNGVLKLQAPDVPNGLTPVATYLVYSEVQTIDGGSMKNERRTRLWEMWNPGWMKQMELPKIQFKQNPDRKYRWEVMYLARPTNFVGDGATNQVIDLNTITHVTRNTLDL